MCLALPGKLIAIDETGEIRMGDVDFSGVVKTICLAFTPDAQTGNYVIVHVGFAISILNEKEARATLDLIEDFH